MKNAYLIIAAVFWIWYGSCLTAMHYNVVVDPRLMMSLTTDAIGFLGASTMLTLLFSMEADKRYAPVCIISFVVVFVFITFNNFGLVTEPRTKLVSIAFVTICCTFIFKKTFN